MLKAVFFLLFFSLNLFAQRWDKENSPSHFEKLINTKISYQFHDLPRRGGISARGFLWSDSYWPSQRGGISYRWNSEPYPRNFDYRRFPTREEVLRMSEEELAKLSPTEKYDLYLSDYNFTFTKQVMALYSPSDLAWEGICHGWALAATKRVEPNRVWAQNYDGVIIPFGSSDVKALLSFYYANIFKAKKYARVGKRCRREGLGFLSRPEYGHPLPFTGDACDDVNPGAFHLVISNMMGVHGKSLIAELSRFGQVWNHPVHSYEFGVYSQRMATSYERSRGVERAYFVRLDLYYGVEHFLINQNPEYSIGRVSMEPSLGTSNQNYGKRTYEYELEVNSKGEIVGGSWVSEDHPDFLWGMEDEADGSFQVGSFNLKWIKNLYLPVL